MSRILPLVVFSIVTASPGLADQPIDTAKWIDGELPALLDTYRWFHQNPELSHQEEQTAARITELWRRDGFRVTTNVGGHGIVGVMNNGEGPVVMLRCDMDALPVTEQTQLPFASTRRAELPTGGAAGVMHACGHDVHMTNLIGTARFMAQHTDAWSGTLMLIGQPAEEKGAGAKAMLDDRLFERFFKPDYAVAIHVGADKKAGEVAVLSGHALANVDSVDIYMKGRSGHGSAPHTAIDPIVQAAELVVALQTIVSREVKPIDPAVVTVGAIHGGTKHNVIGDNCHLQLTVRSYGDKVRAQIREAIERKTKAVAQSHRAPEPDIVFAEGTPSLKNDADLTARLKAVFERTLGEDKVHLDEASMGGEDFSRYGQAGVPILMYRLGSVSEARLERFRQLGVSPPSLHSGLYYPDDIELTLRTGLQTMTAAALELLSK